VETLQEMPDSDSKLLNHSLQQMQEQTERMQYLVDDLLLLSNLETQPRKSECVNIPALLEKIFNENSSLTTNPERIDLQLISNANLFGDEQELRSAFTNLLSNAIKYSPPDTPIVISWHQSDKNLIFTVTDQGEGIDAEEIPRITERFYRVEVKRAQKISGTGLGLAIVKHVLLRHDAQLIVTSQVQKGSKFSCHFPLSRKC
jgi:two-component system, OmpR family, phosphate regulon sensor histidine kinase PhoR